jgi:hypothetical protein
VPDLSKKPIVTELVKVFNKYANVMWQPLPEQFKQVIQGTSSTRLDYDFDVLSALSNAVNVSIDETTTKNELRAIYSEMLSLL